MLHILLKNSAALLLTASVLHGQAGLSSEKHALSSEGAKPIRLTTSPLLKHLKPNPTQTTNETVSGMWVPEGFQVDLVASEPVIRQPIAFTFDAKGRIWVAEAFAYPHRQKAGNDRLVILSDEDADGSFETKKIFADNLNLISGFEIGYGGVFVGAAPELLFIPDRDGDDKPDGPVVTLLDGWDTTDTHETPNSFLWGHDGWLYGCHGVFNDSWVGKPGTPKDKRLQMKAGVWRFHPVTHKFEVYASGGSNQWGLDYNADGAMFMTHCRSFWGLGPVSQVLRDGHYWTQDNKHHRDFIAIAQKRREKMSTPLTNLLRTISKHGHGEGGAGKKGSREIYGGHSHVGTMIYLGDNWPEAYRGDLFTHNLHGHQMNREKLTQKDSGYLATSVGHDQLYTPDKRYLGVDLKYGPDGAVYMIDWHDTQQCHTKDHALWDRTNGRIYRMAWKKSFTPARVDLTQSTDHELVDMLSHPNEWFARMAQHQLRQRAAKNEINSVTAESLQKIISEPNNPHRFRAMVALYGIGGINKNLYRSLLTDHDEVIRTQAVHCITEQSHDFSLAFSDELTTMARTDKSSQVRLAIAGASQHRVDKIIARKLLESLAMRHEDKHDQFIPKMIWFAYAQFANAEPQQALAFALKVKLPVLRESIFWYVARKDFNMAVTYASKLEKPENASRIIAMLDQALDHPEKINSPTDWKKLIAKASSDASTQRHFASLQHKLSGKVIANDNLATRIAKGKATFMICATCHAPGKDQPGPSLEEISQVYSSKKDLIKWIKQPGKKRVQYPAMPAFNHMDNESLELITEYLMSLKK